MNDKEKLEKLQSTVISIYDYLKLEDVNGNMRELNKETFTEMMFRKAKGSGSDLNTLLGLNYIKPTKLDKDEEE